MIFIIFACLPELDRNQNVEIPNNPFHDNDGDGWTENSGDCDDNQANINEEVRFYYDEDQDGYANELKYIEVCSWTAPEDFEVDLIVEVDIDEFDCDDSDPEVNPSELEICDSKDNDCNGAIDERVTELTPRFYVDQDGDGYGRPIDADGDGVMDDEDDDGYPDASIQACYKPEGYVEDNTDCDDQDSKNFPNNVEVCDGTDNNCNGVSDEPAASDASIWYADSDNDGFPSTSTFVVQCEPPDGYILERDDGAVDCNDLSDATNPDVEEICNNKDDDCNGLIDDGVGVGLTLCYLDIDGDGFGLVTDVVEACGCDVGRVIQSGDCDDNNSEIFPGSVTESSTLCLLDVDGDGFGDLNAPAPYDIGTDCDDSNSITNPSATEYCNGLDNDCNGTPDDNAVDRVVYYEDNDSDGFGSAVTLISCPLSDGQGGWTIPSGYVVTSGDCDDYDQSLNNLDLDGDGVSTCDGDCDDLDSTTNPTATEYCNGLDNDCNGTPDDNAADPSVYYEDLDGDGVGGSTTYVSCPTSNGLGGWTDPSGYSTHTGDCNDSDPSISPWMTEQCLPANVDENCDGHTTFGAYPFNTYYADPDDDGFGEPTYLVEGCVAPLGYVQVDPTTAEADCNSSDNTTYPGAPELCNGKLDDCRQNDGLMTPPSTERDLDGDNYVECSSFSLGSWQGSTAVFDAAVLGEGGGGDCDGNDVTIFPGAPETCDGIFQDCSDSEYLLEPSPALERDDDQDGFVECLEYDSLTWQGSLSVVDGGDCDDTNATTFPGAVSTPNTYECFADANADGIADCALDPYGSWTTCDEGNLLDFYGQQMDFVYITGGTTTIGSPSPQDLNYPDSPEWGRKTYEYRVDMTLSHNLYVQTSEVTQGQYEAYFGDMWTYDTDVLSFVDFYGFGEDLPVYYVSWHMAADFANIVTARHNTMKGDGIMDCYTCTDSGTLDVQCEQSMDPYTCDGYRLPTFIEWEYFTRGDSTGTFWTPDGIGNLPKGSTSSFPNQINAKDDCSYDNWFFDDGVYDQDTLSQYTLADFAWYCQNANSMVHSVRGLLPNYYGLYDVHGNVTEWIHDLVDSNTITNGMAPQTDYLGVTDPVELYRSVKGDGFVGLPRTVRTSAYGKRVADTQYQVTGIRLVRRAFPVQ